MTDPDMQCTGTSTSLQKKNVSRQPRIGTGEVAPRRNSGLFHTHEAICIKRRKQIGSSMAYKAMGTFLSQE